MRAAKLLKHRFIFSFWEPALEACLPIWHTWAPSLPWNRCKHFFHWCTQTRQMKLNETHCPKPFCCFGANKRRQTDHVWSIRKYNVWYVEGLPIFNENSVMNLDADAVSHGCMFYWCSSKFHLIRVYQSAQSWDTSWYFHPACRPGLEGQLNEARLPNLSEILSSMDTNNDG